jgi:hypothetical protein
MPQKPKESVNVSVAKITLIGTIVTGILSLVGVLVAQYYTVAGEQTKIFAAKTESALIVETPTIAIPTNTISPTQAPIYSLPSGTLDIPPSSSLRSFFGSGIIKKNFMAKVIFYVPYSADKGVWDVGFTFGDGIRVVVVSSGKWGFNKPSLSLINLPASLALQEGESNSLSLTVYEDSGCFFVNNQFVADLDLSALETDGEIKLMTSYIVGSSLENETATLKFSDFEIYSVDTLECD